MYLFFRRDGRTRVIRRAIAAAALSALWMGVAPASAQIISTSIPKADAAGQAQEKKFALHVMASPLSKWRYNEIVAGAWEDDFGDLHSDIGLFSGTPNSDFLLAGEAVVRAGRSITIGFGGWYNKVGKVNYDFNVNTYNFDTGTLEDNVTGTLQGDLKLTEGHASVFYKDIGVQAGVVRTKSTLTASQIRTSNFPDNIGQPLGSIEVDENSSATDWDLYGVYKYSGQTRGQSGRPFGLSAGAGIYNKQGSTESAQRSAEDQVVFSSFFTGTVDVYKGLGVDVSYWYIAKTEADFGTGTPVSSEKATNRFTIGVSYTFSK